VLPESTLDTDRLRRGSDHNAGLCPTATAPRGKGFALCQERLTTGDSSRGKETPGLEQPL